MEEDELRAEAEQLAKDKKPADLAKMAFVYSYVANHELRMLLDKLDWVREKLAWHDKLLLGIGAAVLLTVFTAVCKIIFG